MSADRPAARRPGAPQNAAQVPVAHTQSRCQPGHRWCRVLPGAGIIQHPGGLPRQHRRRVLHRPVQRAGCQLGPATQAGPKSCALGLCGQREEAAVLASRRTHLADWPAIDAGRRHAGEKATIEALVVRQQRQVTGVVGIDGIGLRHARIVPAASARTGRFRTCAFNFRGWVCRRSCQ